MKKVGVTAVLLLPVSIFNLILSLSHSSPPFPHLQPLSVLIQFDNSCFVPRVEKRFFHYPLIRRHTYINTHW